MYHHIIYICDFFGEFRRLFCRGLHEFSRNCGLHQIYVPFSPTPLLSVASRRRPPLAVRTPSPRWPSRALAGKPSPRCSSCSRVRGRTAPHQPSARSGLRAPAPAHLLTVPCRPEGRIWRWDAATAGGLGGRIRRMRTAARPRG